MGHHELGQFETSGMGPSTVVEEGRRPVGASVGVVPQYHCPSRTMRGTCPGETYYMNVVPYFFAGQRISLD